MLIDDLRIHIPKIKEKVDARIEEFNAIKRQDSKIWFKELCFCLMTANYSAEGGLRIQKEVNDGFFTLSEQELSTKLAELGHRYPNMRAKFVIEARKYAYNLKEELMATPNKRDWLVKNIKGLGMKEASHFLRNIGFLDNAIVDRHIMRMLENRDGYVMPNTLTPKKYLEIESYLERIARQLNISQGELDFYIWHMATNKILK